MAKTVSFAVVHFAVVFSVGYVLIGDILVSSAISLIEPAINTVAFFVHEKVWNVRERKQAFSKNIVMA